MLSHMLAIGILPASASFDDVDAPSAAQLPAPVTTPTATAAEPRLVPWNLLMNRRLAITIEAGTTSEGIFLGFEGGSAILEADDGTLISIASDDVANVRTVKAPFFAPPTIPIPPESTPLSFRDEQARVDRLVNQRIARIVNASSIAGGVIASLSAVSSVVAEGFNIRRWSLSSRSCGERYSYYGSSDDELCGWTDGTEQNSFASYAYYENIVGFTTASTIALPLHFGGLLTLVPSTILRNRTGYREGRKRHIAAWALWGAGLASLTANQAVSWTQLSRTQQVCAEAETSTSCRWITRTRGAPPSLYLLSAGLTLSSAILGILDSRSVARSAERAASADTAKARTSPSVAVFPVSLHRGGGVGIAGRF